MKAICFAGGCFWGIEAFLRRLPGVADCVAGYANGTGCDCPDYEAVCSGRFGFAEAVQVCYDPQILPLPVLLSRFFSVIDPTAYHRQGPDVGVQYRTGVYYTDGADEECIRAALHALQAQYVQPILTEVQPLQCFYPAEEYHQRYLEKHPGGYCHFSLRGKLRPVRWPKKISLPGAAYSPSESGIFVEAESGEPLFSTRDREGDGLFTCPIEPEAVFIRPQESPPKAVLCSGVGRRPIGELTGEGLFAAEEQMLRFVPRRLLDALGYGDYIQEC